MEEQKNKKIDERIFQNVFNGNSLSFFISSKINRILNAIYLVTDKIKATEPLRNFIRQRASNPDIMGIIIKDKVSANLAVENLVVLKKSLETAYSVGLVSSMNFEVISNECDEIISVIFDAGTDVFTTDPTINQKYFSVEKKPNVQGVLSQGRDYSKPVRREDYKGQTKGHNDVLNNIGAVNINQTSIKSTVSKVANSSVFNKDSRGDRVLNIIENRGEVTIKDISILVTDFSEKTIQRELNNLVTKGVVKRTGERRWSRYSLV